MKITIMGSAAAEAIPAMWCECDTCCEAKKRGGKDVRMRTSYLIDDDTLVDFGPDAFQQALRFDINWDKIRRIVFTHSHDDHLNPVELRWRQPSFSQVKHDIKVFGSRKVFDRIVNETGMQLEELRMIPVEMHHGDSVDDGDIAVSALRAWHEEYDGQALNYVFTRDAKSVLIANDTGWWEDDSWQVISGHRLNAAIIEATGALGPDSINWRKGHMGADVTVEFRDKLLELGAISNNIPVIANHFTHNGKSLHRDLCEFFEPKNIAVGFDGMILEL